MGAFPVPRTHDEIMHVPKFWQHERSMQQHVEAVVEVPVPMIQEEIVHVPQVLQQERIFQQHVETVVEVPVPMIHEEFVQLPRFCSRSSLVSSMSRRRSRSRPR